MAATVTSVLLITRGGAGTGTGTGAGNAHNMRHQQQQQPCLSSIMPFTAAPDCIMVTQSP